MSSDNLPDDFKALRRLTNGYWSSRVLITANNFGLFDRLVKPATAGEVASAAGIKERAAFLILNALTGLGLLKKKGNKYINAPISSRLLIKGSPYYQGDIIRHADSLWENWSGLDDVLKTGGPHREAHDHHAFIMGMHNIAVFKAKAVIDAVGMKGIKTALDLGGGPGTYSEEMAGRGVSVTLFDTPETIEIARERLKKTGIGGIRLVEGDFLANDFAGTYDLILISQIFHAYSEKGIIPILKKSIKSLNPGGRAVIQEFYLKEDMAQPSHSSLFAINMLVNTAGGRCYTVKELKAFLRQTGFRNIKSKIMVDTVLVEGKK
jgi:ubiquinone/menaquinone biosynthesis C-methylase UbiE